MTSPGPRKLLTAPLSVGDFALRLAFFSLAPFVIVPVAELFPVRGALVDVGLALVVFVASDAVRRGAARSKVLAWLVAQALAFEDHYRERPPKPFLYYLLYPLLFPYWLANREARREFLVFRGYTIGGLAILLATLVHQFVTLWRPDLGIRSFLPAVALTLAVETVLVLSLLMPMATTVVWYHSTRRRRRLAVLLVAGLASTTASLATIAHRRDAVVTYLTRERVRLRTAVDRGRAHRVMRTAARAAWKELVFMEGVDGDGKVEGSPLERARQSLRSLYKEDEARAFDLWAAPRRHPRILVLYFEARPKKPPLWVAIGGDGRELKRREDLPRGAFTAMRAAADGTDPVLPLWPEDLDLPAVQPSF